jgi:hypothetical protein
MKGGKAMAVGYGKPLYLLAFDHRGSFERDLFGAAHPVSEKVRAGIVDTNGPASSIPKRRSTRAL